MALMYRYLIVTTLVSAVVFSSATAVAKTLPEFGWKSEFWKHHDVIYCEITSVERKQGDWRILCEIETSATAKYESRAKIEVVFRPRNYLGSLSEANFERLRKGDWILTLINLDEPIAQIPDGVGSQYLFMPRDSALYVVPASDDRQAKDSLDLSRAISVSDIRPRLEALATLQRNNPSKWMQSRIRGCLSENVIESNEALRRAEDLLRVSGAAVPGETAFEGGGGIGASKPDRAD